MGLRKRKPESLVCYEEGGAVGASGFKNSGAGALQREQPLDMYEAAEANANKAKGCRNEETPGGLG